MNIILYVIFGWTLGELLHLTAWEWLKTRLKLENSKVTAILTFISLALIIAIISSGLYRTTSNENVILTTISGEKIIRDSFGIRFSLLSSRETVNVQKQIMKFPDDYPGIVDAGYEIITSDEKPLRINSFLEFRISDTYKWGVENKDSEQKLLILFASKVKNAIQKSDYNYVRNNLDSLEEEVKKGVLDAEGIYGIEVINVNLQISDTVNVKKAKSDAESQKIKSESEKKANNLLKDSLDPFTPEQLDYMKTRMLSESGSIKWVISEGGSVIVNSGEPAGK